MNNNNNNNINLNPTCSSIMAQTPKRQRRNAMIDNTILLQFAQEQTTQTAQTAQTAQTTQTPSSQKNWILYF